MGLNNIYIQTSPSDYGRGGNQLNTLQLFDNIVFMLPHVTLMIALIRQTVQLTR